MSNCLFLPLTPPIAEILCVKNVGAFVFCGFFFKHLKKYYVKKKIMGVTCYMAQPIQPISTQIGLHWLCYLAGNSQTTPQFFFINFQDIFLNYFNKNTQTTNAPTFLTHNISAIGGMPFVLSFLFQFLIPQNPHLVTNLWRAP